MPDKGLFCGMNHPGNPGNLTEMEKMHVPFLECPDRVKAGDPFQVKVKVGEIPHVAEEAHHVQWIEIKSGENLYARFELTPVLSKPEVSVVLVKAGRHGSGTLRVIERCNIHGLWESTKEIIVDE